MSYSLLASLVAILLHNVRQSEFCDAQAVLLAHVQDVEWFALDLVELVERPDIATVFEFYLKVCFFKFASI